VQAAAKQKKPVASLFTLPKGEKSKVKTEILFIERCLSLLQPGGKLGIVLPEGIFNNPSLAYVREFCEDRAFIKAIVSLPQETFSSSGASVKASLLFIQKFSEQEQAEFNTKKAQATADITAGYQSEIDRLTAIIERPRFKQADFLTEIEKPTKKQKEEAATKAKDSNVDLKAKKEQAEKDLKTLNEKIRVEARALLKERFPYPIFLYEADKVGITATGEDDFNELCRYPKDNVPPGVDKTCLELHREFSSNPDAFLLKEPA
jgi:type I restriction enzyme M protein